MAVLRTPYLIISLFSSGKNEPDEVFRLWDRIISASVRSGEGDRASTCSFTILDPGHKIGALYRRKSLAIGGIAVPQGVIANAPTTITTTAPPEGGPLALAQIPDGTTGDELARYIIAYARARGVTDLHQLAAILGTCEKESSMGKFLQEIGSDAYLRSRHYWPHIGYGLIQVTWEDNYRFVGDKLGVDFVSDPSKLKELRYAIPALVDGMAEGWYTGSKLADYADYKKNRDTYFRKTRLIVNPGEGGSRLAEYVRMCETWLTRLTHSPTFTSEQAALLPQNTGQVVSSQASPAIALGQVPEESIEIQIEQGWNDSDEIHSYAYWLTGVTVVGGTTDTTRFTGRTVRSSLVKTKKRDRVLQNISLRQFAQQLQALTGLTIETVDTPAAETLEREFHQRRETDYQVLLRMAAAHGYAVVERDEKISLEPVKGQVVTTVDRSFGATFDISEDQADEHRLIQKLPPISQLPDGQEVGEGYRTQLSIPYPSMQAMGIRPGQIIELAHDFVAPPFARDYRVKIVGWDWDRNGCRGEVQLYIPVAIQKPDEEKPAVSDGPQAVRGRTPIPKKDGPFMFLHATGKVTNAGEAELILERVQTDGLRGETVYAVSGSGNNQNLESVYIMGSYAPCPAGTYELGQAETAPGDSWGPGLGPYWISVPNTPGREAIGIHTDDNRDQGSPGTAGCIGVIAHPEPPPDREADFTARKEMQKVMDWRREGIDTLVIDYSQWPQELGGPNVAGLVR